MKRSTMASVLSVALLGAIVFNGSAQSARKPRFDWATVVNNTDPMPGDPAGRTFNSYNQPSVNMNGLGRFGSEAATWP